MKRFTLSFLALMALIVPSCADVFDLLRAGLSARVRGDFEGAVKFYTQAIETGALADEKLAIVLASRGVAYDAIGQTENAIADFDQAIDLKPDYGDAYVHRGLAWAKKREFGHSISDFTRAIGLDSNSAVLALNDRGNVYELLGRIEAAIEDYSAAIRRDSDYPAYYNRARVYFLRKEFDHAIGDYNQAIRLRPDFAEAYYNRGVLYQTIGENAKADADFKAARFFEEESHGSRPH